MIGRAPVGVASCPPHGRRRGLVAGRAGRGSRPDTIPPVFEPILAADRRGLDRRWVRRAVSRYPRGRDRESGPAASWPPAPPPPQFTARPGGSRGRLGGLICAAAATCRHLELERACAAALHSSSSRRYTLVDPGSPTLRRLNLRRVPLRARRARPAPRAVACSPGAPSHAPTWVPKGVDQIAAGTPAVGHDAAPRTIGTLPPCTTARSPDGIDQIVGRNSPSVTRRADRDDAGRSPIQSRTTTSGTAMNGRRR